MRRLNGDHDVNLRVIKSKIKADRPNIRNTVVDMDFLKYSIDFMLSGYI